MLKTQGFQAVILQKSIKLLRKKQKKPKEINKERLEKWQELLETQPELNMKKLEMLL